jgi:uncharacterized protein YxjI
MFDLRAYLVKERVGLLKLCDTYDIFDPDTGEQVGVAKEEIPGWAKLARLIVNKRLLPTTVNLYAGSDGSGEPALSLTRGVALCRPKVEIFATSGTRLGYFKAKLFSLGGGFFVHGNDDQQVGEVKGDWKGWNFRFLDAQGKELGMVTKKWAGLGKELFTSADNYMISLNDGVELKPAVAKLLLAAGIAIDTVFKEGQS